MKKNNLKVVDMEIRDKHILTGLVVKARLTLVLSLFARWSPFSRSFFVITSDCWL